MNQKYSYVCQKISQEIDQKLFNKYKIISEIAMELAGQAVAHSFHDFLSNKLKINLHSPGNILVLAGPGSFLIR